MASATPAHPVADSNRSKHRSGKKRGRRPDDHQHRRLVPRSDVVGTSTFSLVEHASFSSTGNQGAQPPREARTEIIRLFHEQPRARSLHPIIRQFRPIPYTKDGMRKEKATFLVDKKGQIFFFRSYRARWLMQRSNELEHAFRVLLRDDLTNDLSDGLRAKHAGGARGSHLPIIIGYHRQSAKAPVLAGWHSKHAIRVQEFLALSIVQDIIRWVASVVQIVFPGVAARFHADAKWHEQKYGIKPAFGLFWNFCHNAWFPGQKRIHCDPHADMKNQIGVCVLVIYVLAGFEFDDDVYTWLVIWEAGVVVQLPPWTLAMYPSSLFFHFNIDVDEIEFVSTKGPVFPTPSNSTPLRHGSDEGRGSMVFFNQSTMCTGSSTGYATLKEARAHGHSGAIDITLTCQEAFERYLELRPMELADLQQ
ncbi:hypothetical protein R3P38DRAFT_2499959 [Favolaschia claudopus]|uniref:Uncharacterized protein n=1 Tax=Favolaschia claudopus TaxID=2862362 RepID=A0AAW0DUB8_9AGAR